MISLEQAILIAEPPAADTEYRLAGASPRMCADDTRELSTWGGVPVLSPGRWCLSFHPLPSGAHAITRTALLGGPAGPATRLYNHCLVAGPEAMARFAGNPFALLRATMAMHPLAVFEQVPEHLPSLQLAGRAAAVDQVLLARLAIEPGARWASALVQAALDSVCLAIAGAAAPEYLISGLMSCLPPECRAGFSFTTGMGFSPERPFRIVGHAGPAAEIASWQQQFNVQVLDVSQSPPDDYHPLDGWARLIERVLTSGRTAFLAAQLSKRRFDLEIGDLHMLGLQLLENLDASALRGDPADKGMPAEMVDKFKTLQHAHAAHRQPAARAENVPRTEAPSKRLRADSPEVLEKLESLDDAVFEAVAGKMECLEMLKTLWPQIRDELGEELLAESREQYLRYALSIWDEYAGCGGVRDPSRAIRAMDVLCVLFDRV